MTLLCLTPDVRPDTRGEKYPEAQGLFQRRRYQEALDIFLDVQSGARAPRNVAMYVDECLRRLKEPWLDPAASAPPRQRLMALLEDRRRAARDLAAQRGEVASPFNPASVRFSASVYNAADDKWRESVLPPLRRLLATFPDPALVLECGKTDEQGPLLAASARLAQALVDGGVLDVDRVAVLMKKEGEAACLVTAASTRTFTLPRSSEAPVPALQAEKLENGDFLFTAFFPDPASVTDWSLFIRDDRKRSLARFPGGKAGFVKTFTWTPGPSAAAAGPLTVVARIETPVGAWEGTEGPLNVSRRPEKPAPQIPQESRHRQVLHFETDSTALQGQSWRFLRQWGRDILPGNPKAKALITGCAAREESGKKPRLALERADAVKKLLKTQFSIDQARLETRTGQEEEPAVFLSLEQVP